MENYNFWKDFFDTYQSLPDWLKFAWLTVPPACLLGLFALILRYRLDSKRAGHGINGKLMYSIHRDEHNQFHIFRHGPLLEHEPDLLLLEDKKPNTVEPQNCNNQS